MRRNGLPDSTIYDNKQDSILGCYNVYFRKQVPAFPTTVLPSSSWSSETVRHIPDDKFHGTTVTTSTPRPSFCKCLLNSNHEPQITISMPIFRSLSLNIWAVPFFGQGNSGPYSSQGVTSLRINVVQASDGAHHVPLWPSIQSHTENRPANKKHEVVHLVTHFANSSWYAVQEKNMSNARKWYNTCTVSPAWMT